MWKSGAWFYITLTTLIAPGHLAEFVVLDSDIAACDPSEIKRVRIMATCVAGEQVFER